MPRIGTNDNSVTIGSWLVKSGAYVEQGQAIAVLETTKETEELKTEKSGYLFYKTSAGEEVNVGASFAVITSEENFVFAEKSDIDIGTLNVTKKAKALIEKYNIDLKSISHLSIIKEKDILDLVGHETKIERSKANDIVIVSGGGMAKMCIDTIRLNKGYNICGIVDAQMPKGTDIMGVDVLGDDSILPVLYNQGHLTAINGIGGIANDNSSELFTLRKQVFENLKSIGFFVPNLIHPASSIEYSAILGEGNIVLSGASIGSEAVIGNNCIINTGAIVSHDCKIGNHVKISPGAILAGNVSIGENSLIGMGVTIYIGVKVGRNVIISNGKNIFQDVPDNAVIK